MSFCFCSVSGGSLCKKPNLQVLLELVNRLRFDSPKRRSSLKEASAAALARGLLRFPLTKRFKPGVKRRSKLSPSRGSVTGTSLIKNAKREGCHLLS